jgi:hypothetical protein
MNHRWLVSYDNSRHKEPNESWANSKYSRMGDWREVQKIYLPSLKMCIGPAWFHLGKLWERYKRNNRIGESNIDTAYQINRYQSGLDLPRTQFDELGGVISDDEFDEDEEGGEEEQEIEERPAEWSSLDELLVREEKEDAAETEHGWKDWLASD